MQYLGIDYCVSRLPELDPAFVKAIFLTPFADVQSAFDAALQKCGEEASVIVMPYGGSTLPLSQAKR